MTHHPLVLRAAFVAGVAWGFLKPLWPYALAAYLAGVLFGLAIAAAPVQP